MNKSTFANDPYNILGKTFEHLTIIEYVEKSDYGEHLYLCQCDCGNQKIISGRPIKRGITVSCGHVAKDTSKLLNKQRLYDGTRIGNLKSTPIASTKTRRGVFWHKGYKKWWAYITVRKQRIHLGFYDDLKEAIIAREEAEEKYFNPIVQEYNENVGGV